MSCFIEIPATKLSLNLRRSTHGVGINDATYMVHKFGRNGKIVGTCPFYRTWKNMLQRCYSEKYHERSPSYEGCSVSDEWLSFMSFRAWMKKQQWEGMELDKDLNSVNNKIYSSSTCIFIDQKLNRLLNRHKNKDSKLPFGVCFYKRSSNYVAQCMIEGKAKLLGYFDTAELAAEAYNLAKSSEVRRYKYIYPEHADSLEAYAKSIENGEW